MSVLLLQIFLLPFLTQVQKFSFEEYDIRLWSLCSLFVVWSLLILDFNFKKRLHPIYVYEPFLIMIVKIFQPLLTELRCSNRILSTLHHVAQKRKSKINHLKVC